MLEASLKHPRLPTLLTVCKRCSFHCICPNTPLPSHTFRTLCSFPGPWQPARSWPHPQNVTLGSSQCRVVSCLFCLHVLAEQGQNSQQRLLSFMCIIDDSSCCCSFWNSSYSKSLFCEPSDLQQGILEKPCWLSQPSDPLRKEFPPQISAG